MSPGPGAVSAVPDRLEGYAGAALDLDEVVRRVGRQVQEALDRFAARPSDVAVRLEPLGQELVALGRAAAALDEWTGRVGTAFRRAGEGSWLLRLLFGLLHGMPFDPFRAQPGWTDDEVAAALESLLGLDPDREPGSIVQPLVDPAIVRTFVASLTPAQLEALVDQHPELVGPVDGMPHELRYRANRVLVDRALQQALADGDDALAASLQRLTGADRQILFFDPAGDGRVAEVSGDLGTATNVTVFVPGVTNKLSNFGATQANAEHLFDEMRRLDPTGSHATIAWLGYDTPELADAPLPGKAERAAPLLRQLWQGLALPDAVNTTVVGHSYGSLVSATALRDGFAEVDNLVVVGSPGLQAGSLDDLDLADGTRFFAARAPFDTLVGSTEAFGRDPSDHRFGGTRLATGRDPDGFVTGHSSYTAPGSESLRNLALVGLGRFDDVTTIEPSFVDRVVGTVDDVHDVVVEGPVDFLQWADEGLDGLVHRGIDEVQERVPLGPFHGVVDTLQDGFDTLDRYGDTLVDGVQRVTSPDFWGDVVGDWIDVDGPEGLIDGVGDALGGLYDSTIGRLPWP